jgi:peptide/nickel transport system substrate-binding protein
VKEFIIKLNAFFLVGLFLVMALLAVSCNKSSPPTSPTSTPASSPTSTTASSPTSTTASTPTTTQQASSPTATKPANLTPKYGGTLRIVMSPASAGFGWPADVAGQGAGVNQFCFETLLRLDSKGNLTPWLAESYKVADDLKSITFKLRQGIKFHDGSNFNAEVVKWNLENYMKSGMEPLYDSVDIIDDYTVRVNFKEWDNTLPASFGDLSTEVYIISKASFDKNGIDWMKQNPVGTGPFKFASYALDSSLKYTKNPDYWKKDDNGNSLPYLDGVDHIFATDPMTQYNIMLSDDADILNLTTGNQLVSLKEKGYKINVDYGVTSLIPDTANTDSLWAKKEFREAVEYSIDREAIAKAFGYGFFEATYQIPPRNTTAFNPNFNTARKYDVNKAKELLAQAGYNGTKTSIIVAPFVEKDIAVALQSYLTKAGIQVDLEFPDMGKFVSYMGPPGTWNNAALLLPMPRVDVNYSGGIKFISGMIGHVWNRTPEFMQAFQAAFLTPALDPKNISKVTDIISSDSSLIPVIENGSSIIQKPYVMAGYDRSSLMMWNSESSWLNK